MSVLLSRGCEYALQAVMYLATQTPNTPILQRDIAKALNIPPHFLGKILQLLCHKGLVASYKGKTGGFLLNKPAKGITPFDIILTIDGLSFLEGCVLGFPGCCDESPCPVHDHWKEMKTKTIHMLQESNMEDLSKGLDNKLEFIKNMLSAKLPVTYENKSPSKKGNK